MTANSRVEQHQVDRALLGLLPTHPMANEVIRRLWHEVQKARKQGPALTAIAEGYPIKVKDDRYIAVENPKFRPDDGSDPFLVIDAGGK